MYREMLLITLFLVSSVVSVKFTPDDCFSVNKRYLIQKVSDETLMRHCEYMSSALEGKPWVSKLGRAVLLNDVAPFTVLTEDPFTHESRRELFIQYVEFIYQTSGCSTVECLSLALNDRIWSIRSPPIIFEPAPPNSLNSYSINETWTRGNGSCTSMSVFLITGLRLLGVPARIAGVPHWNLGPEECPLGDASPSCGNHNWVEVYVPDVGWSFIDQRRPDQLVLPLNQSWFFPEWTEGVSTRNGGNHSIYAASFAPVDELSPEGYPVGEHVDLADHYPLAWDWKNKHVHAWDVSEAYRRYESMGELVVEFE